MVDIVFFTQNAIGGFTPQNIEEFNTYDEAVDFYIMNRERYRSHGIYLKINRICRSLASTPL